MTIGEYRILELGRAFGADGAEEGGAEVTVATVGKDYDDCAGRHIFCYL
jgi:hypothetical protein